MNGWQTIYEQARAIGWTHETAMDAVEAGEVRCWCGRVRDICPIGHLKLIGCPVRVDTPHGSTDFSVPAESRNATYREEA